ncbi:MAG TPA: tetratricopeptide repeat protein [bacterium]
MKCPKCGFENPAASKFCNQCGSALGDAPTDHERGQRRAVAVVFADISGFTPLSENLDPEEVKDLIDACLKRLAGVITKYEGYVDKFIGDCIMAVFGAPVAHEDDPLRAVLSAMDMLQEIGEFNREKKQKLSLTIGINYGMVATGDLGRPGAYTVMGDTVNLAQRLQASAPRGKIFVSGSVYAQTSSEINYQRRDKIRVKGKKEPVEVYVPSGVVRKYSLRKIKELPFIGRQAELQKLRSICNKMYAGQGQVISVIGEAGIGKSKLVYELRQLLKAGTCLVEGRGIEYLRASPYGVLKEMLKQMLGIAEDPPATASQKIAEYIKRQGDPGLVRAASLFRYILSLELTRDEDNLLESMKPEDRIRMINEALITLFHARTIRSPVVIIFEDCHWIDRETADFMRLLAGAVERCRIMVIAIYRPEFETGSLAKLRYFNAIPLKPLNTGDAVSLLRNIMNCECIDKQLLALLVGKSGGLPFYLHELASNLVQNGLITVQDSVAVLKPGKDFVVPRTLDELVMTKIDRLAPPVRAVVDTAAVIGDEFSVRLLDRLMDLGNALPGHLSQVCDQGILVPLARSVDQPAADVRYGFRHSIIRDAVYNSLLKKEAKKKHFAVATAIENVYAGNLAEYYDALAEHFEKGGERSRAVEYMGKAADHKKALYLNAAAIALYQNILKSLDMSRAKERALVYEKLGEVYSLIGDYQSALHAYHQVGILKTGESVLKIRSHIAVAGVYKNLGTVDAALASLEKASRVLRAEKNLSADEKSLQKVHILTLECWLTRVKGRVAEAEQKGLEAISMINAQPGAKDYGRLKRALADAYYNLAIVYCVKGDFEKAIDLCEDTLMIAEELGDRRGKASVYNILGTVYRSQGKYNEAIEAFEMKLKTSAELGDKSGIGIAYSNLGNVYQNRGEYARAIEYFEKHLDICNEVGDKSGVGLAQNNLGIIYFSNDEYARAIQAFESYLGISKELGDKRGIAIASGNLGEVHESLFDYKKAGELFTTYLAISEELGDRRGKAFAAHSLAIACIETGQFSKALEYLKASRDYMESIGNKVGIGGIYNSIAYLHYRENKLDDALEAALRALKYAEETHAMDVKLNALLHIGRVNGWKAVETKAGADRDGYMKKAAEYFSMALTLAQSQKKRRMQADILLEYANALQALGKTSESRQLSRQAMAIYKELGLADKVKAAQH